MGSILAIAEDNLSVAWGRAFLSVVEAGEIAPLTVTIRSFERGEPEEVESVRQLLDDALRADARGLSCHAVANTIFPVSLWAPHAPRQQLYDRYLRILPRVRKHPRNRYGVYFERLIAFGHDDNVQDGINQLEHIIQTWLRGNHRRTALQAAILDPTKDHTNQRQRGFPCLQQIAFAGVGTGGLSVTGFYSTQHMFERAYGNYLGLCRLGRFMGHAMGLTLMQVTCVASPAKRDRPKGSLLQLACKVDEILNQL